MAFNIKTDEFRLNDSELKTVCRKMCAKSFNLLKKLILIGVVLNLLNLFLVIKIAVNPEAVRNLMFSVFMLMIPIGALILYFKKTFQQLKNNQLLKQSSMIEIDGNYICQSYEDGSYQKLNISLLSIVDKKENLYIFIRDELIDFILPDRAFASETRLQEFKDFLLEKKLLSSV